MIAPVPLAFGIGLTIALLAGGVASAASPKKGGRYIGKSSQGARVSITVDRKRRIELLDIDLTTSCSRIGSVGVSEEAFDIQVRKDGSFTDTPFSLYPIDERVVNGQRVDLWAVAKNEVNGKFRTPREASGTWRARNALYDFNVFPDKSDPVDKCDTGVVSWRARLRR